MTTAEMRPSRARLRTSPYTSLMPKLIELYYCCFYDKKQAYIKIPIVANGCCQLSLMWRNRVDRCIEIGSYCGLPLTLQVHPLIDHRVEGSVNFGEQWWKLFFYVAQQLTGIACGPIVKSLKLWRNRGIGGSVRCTESAGVGDIIVRSVLCVNLVLNGSLRCFDRLTCI